MNILTRFNVGDQIYFLSNKKVVDSIVRGIKIEISPKDQETTTTYLCNGDDKENMVHIKVDENDAFKTKDQLLKSL